MGLAARARPKTETAGGCRVCGMLPPPALVLPRVRALICRPCAARLGRFLEGAPDSFLARLWGKRAPVDSGPPAASAPRTENALRAHYDLALAYREMGLAPDAVRSFAVALDDRAGGLLASEAFFMIFESEPARADALDAAIAEMRARGA